MMMLPTFSKMSSNAKVRSTSSSFLVLLVGIAILPLVALAQSPIKEYLGTFESKITRNGVTKQHYVHSTPSWSGRTGKLMLMLHACVCVLLDVKCVPWCELTLSQVLRRLTISYLSSLILYCTVLHRRQLRPQMQDTVPHQRGRLSKHAHCLLGGFL